MLNAIRETWRRLTVREVERVEHDGEGVRRRRPGGKTESVRWDELVEVGIITTDEGPFVEDVYWLLLGPDGTGCALPGHLVEGELLHRLQALPGFDNMAVIQAMGSCENASFVCWRR